nr:helicase-associated domain-containing protein [Candidatus Microthrix sp.]
MAQSVLAEVHDKMGRYGRLRLVRDHDTAALALTSAEPALLEEVSRDKQVAELLGDRLDGNRFAVRNGDRGVLKQALIRLGWPAADEAGYAKGTRLEGAELTAELRSYRSDALAAVARAQRRGRQRRAGPPVRRRQDHHRLAPWQPPAPTR